MEYTTEFPKSTTLTEMYHGALDSNYQRCIVIVGDQLYYDKARDPRYLAPGLHLEVFGCHFAYWRAIENAQHLGGTPIIATGYWPENSPYMRGYCMEDTKECVIPEGVLFPISKLWVPRDDSWKNIPLSEVKKPGLLEVMFQQVDPKSLLLPETPQRTGFLQRLISPLRNLHLGTK